MQEQTELAVNDAFYAKAFEMQQIFVDRPELWPDFHRRQDLALDSLLHLIPWSLIAAAFSMARRRPQAAA
jgi:hypothetical protein